MRFCEYRFRVFRTSPQGTTEGAPRNAAERDWRTEWSLDGLARQFAQEFLLVKAVFEGFTAVDEDDGHFVGEPAA